MITVSRDQKIALEKILKWYKNPDKGQYITLGGYAGTGKTTLISIIRQVLNKHKKKLKVAFCSYTGKASRVMKSKLIESNAIVKRDTIGTIHSLIYSPIEDDNDIIVGWERKDEINCDLIVIDEASMVDQIIWDDLLSYDKPIIAVGDHGQLPPIRGNFNLMETPELKLEAIHRQMKDNPIIKISAHARNSGEIPFGKYGKHVKKLDKTNPETQEIIESLLADYNDQTLILCGYNHTRVKLNEFVRNVLDFTNPEPVPSDRVICLRNNHTKKIYNGMLGTISSIHCKDKEWYNAEIEMDDEENVFEGKIYTPQFGSREPFNFTKDRRKMLGGDLFDFGYALTVHKAQGSQAKRVLLFEERFSKMDDDMWKRWLYTAVTRAEEELYIFG